MAARSDPELLVLQGLRLTSFASSDVVAEAGDLPVETVDRQLGQFREEQWVRHREGALTGWMLSPAGRAEGERRLAREVDVRLVLGAEGAGLVERVRIADRDRAVAGTGGMGVTGSQQLARETLDALDL